VSAFPALSGTSESSLGCLAGDSRSRMQGRHRGEHSKAELGESGREKHRGKKRLSGRNL
jgi:hypothetical protein